MAANTTPSGRIITPFSMVGIAVSFLWIIAMLFLPFQTVGGEDFNNVSVMPNAFFGITTVIAVGIASVFDFFSRAGAEAVFAGIIMIIWSAKSMIETTNAGWDFAFGAYVAMGCAIITAICGALCWMYLKRNNIRV